jgi:pimeloyl-ACP methyl ester carboxylesterase
VAVEPRPEIGVDPPCCSDGTSCLERLWAWQARRSLHASGRTAVSGLAFVSANPSNVRAAISFDGGHGGHFHGRPNNNCHPDQLVDATRILGRTARTPVLWIYVENDSYFGPQLSKQMFQAWEAALGNAEYHLLPAFKEEGHLLVDYPQAVPVWAPIVQHFLAEHP